jgi:hypothetical protein
MGGAPTTEPRRGPRMERVDHKPRDAFFSDE